MIFFFKIIKTYLWKVFYKKILFLSILAVVSGIAEFLTTLMIPIIVSKLSNQNPLANQTIHQLFPNFGESFLLVIILFAILSCLSLFIRLIFDYSTFRYSAEMGSYVSKNIFTSFLSLDYRDFISLNRNEYTNTLINCCNEFTFFHICLH